MKFSIFLAVLFLRASIFSQKEIEPVEINAKKNQNLDSNQYFGQTIGRKAIENSGLTDVGELARKFNGVSLRNYGAIGGLKTFTYRGFGSNHLTIIEDGFALVSAQSGSIDLGNLKSNNINELSLTLGQYDANNLPASAFLGASLLSIKTNTQKNIPNKVMISSASTLGSFGYLDQNLILGFGPNTKWNIIVSGGVSKAIGKYPFSYKNTDSTTRETRKNNDFYGKNISFSSQYTGGKHVFLLTSAANTSEQGLPGAVILYAPKSIQRLSRAQQRVGFSHQWKSQRFVLRNFASAQNDNLKYVDSSFLNSEGFLEAKYNSVNIAVGTSASYALDSTWKIWYNTEFSFQKLQTKYFGFKPSRKNQTNVFGVCGTFLSIHITAFIANLNYTLDQKMTNFKDKWKLQNTYFVGLSKIFKVKVNFRPHLFLKSSFRLPSFNDLYYQQIGNINLKPELAHQINAQINFGKEIHTWGWNFSFDVFANQIENRILAIPTKNLFQWSIQNVGLSQGAGAETKLDISKTIGFHRIGFDFGYSFQQIRDKSDSKSVTYNDLLPYQPVHSFSSEINYSFKKFGVSVFLNTVGERFALAQNIEFNKLEGFALVDLNFWKRFTLKRHNFKTVLNIKNITNSSYFYVRNYYMPGINFQFSVLYDFL